MKREPAQVPFGYEPPVRTVKGTLVFYDSFEYISDEELGRVLDITRTRLFKKLVLYPLHEETVRRMSKQPVAPYYKREKQLFDWKKEAGSTLVTVETWEGKRKKYTPFEAAVRHLEEIYSAPLFLYVTPEVALQLASYASFEEVITKVRLILSERPASHAVLQKFQHRWQVAGEEEQLQVTERRDSK